MLTVDDFDFVFGLHVDVLADEAVVDCAADVELLVALFVF